MSGIFSYLWCHLLRGGRERESIGEKVFTRFLWGVPERKILEVQREIKMTAENVTSHSINHSISTSNESLAIKLSIVSTIVIYYHHRFKAMKAAPSFAKAAALRNLDSSTKKYRTFCKHFKAQSSL